MKSLCKINQGLTVYCTQWLVVSYIIAVSNWNYLSNFFCKFIYVIICSSVGEHDCSLTAYFLDCHVMCITIIFSMEQVQCNILLHESMYSFEFEFLFQLLAWPQQSKCVVQTKVLFMIFMCYQKTFQWLIFGEWWCLLIYSVMVIFLIQLHNVCFIRLQLIVWFS